MKVTVRLDKNLQMIGEDSRGHKTMFDTHPNYGGEDTAPSPMEIVLQALGACTFLDVISILKKKRRQVDDLKIYIEGHRREDHPKVFTKAHLIYELTSPDAEEKDLARAVELSEEKYCSVSAMFKQSGCEVTWEIRLVTP